MPQLTAAQLQTLNNFQSQGMAIQYYEALASFGEAYGTLARSVVTDEGISGQVARRYAEAVAVERGVTINSAIWGTISRELMQADYDARVLAGANGQDNINLDVDYIRAYHVDVFAQHGLPPEAWTAYVPLQLAGAGQEGAVWAEMKQVSWIGQVLNGTSIVFDVMQAQVGSHAPEYLAAYLGAGLPGALAAMAVNVAYGDTDADLWIRNMFLRGAAFAELNAGAPGTGAVFQLEGGGQFILGAGATHLSLPSTLTGVFARAPASEQLTGTAFDDHIVGLGGDDELIGGAGNDALGGGSGSDVLIGGAGNDILIGGDQGYTEILGFGRDVASYESAAGAVTVAIGSNDRQILVTNDGDGGHDLLIGIEVVRLTDHADTVRIESADPNLRYDLHRDLEIEFGAGANVLDMVNAGIDSPNPFFGVGTNFKFSTQNADQSATATGQVQIITIGADFAGEDSNNMWLYVDGRQLIGGASFDFDKFDLFGGHGSYFFDMPDLGLGTTVDRLTAWGQDLSNKALDFVTGLTGGLSSGSLSFPGAAFAFVPILLSDIMTAMQSWYDDYIQRYVGGFGERYDLVRTGSNDDGDIFDLTITLRQTAADGEHHKIIVHGWQQGDLGLRVVDLGWRNGLESNLNKNGQRDDWQDLSLDWINTQLASVGLSIGGGPDQSPLQRLSSFSASAPEAGVTRQGNAGANVLAGGGAADLLRGDRGDDTLRGGEGRDVYVFAAGDGTDVIEDLSVEGAVLRFLDGLNPASLYKELTAGDAGQQDLLIWYGAGDSIRIKGWSTLTTEQRALWAFEGVAAGLSSNDPAETPDLSVAPESLGGTVRTVVNGTAGADVVHGSDLDEAIQLFDGDDVVTGGGGNDRLYGEDGLDTLQGDDGDDRIEGGAGADFIEGGRGADVLIGGLGVDIYRFSLGDGVDTIVDSASQGFFADDASNVLMLGEGIAPSDIRIVRDPDDMSLFSLVIGDDGDRIDFDGGADMDSLDKVVFANGVTWTNADLRALYLRQAATAGADTIVAFDERDDILAGGIGDDRLLGGMGRDSYLWNRGDGHDQIIDTGYSSSRPENGDRLVFGAGVSPADVTFSQPAPNGQLSYDLLVTVGGANGGSVTLVGYFWDATNGVDKIVFANGTVWSRAEIDQRYLAPHLTSSNDLAEGTASADVLLGGDGNDVLHGQRGADTLDGGAGNDRLEGSNGDAKDYDLYRFGTGFGQDVIYDNGNMFGDPGPAFPYSDGNPGADRVEFTAHNLGDLGFSWVGAEGGALLITVAGATDQVTIEQFGSYRGLIETFKFADGSVLTWQEVWALANAAGVSTTINGSAAGETLTGGAGDERISAGAGDDVVNAGAGADVVQGAAGTDILNGGDDADRLFGGIGTDTLAGDQGDDLLWGESGADILLGGAGVDQLAGGLGDDQLSGGTGDDLLIGGAGADTYQFNRGDGHETIDAAADRGLAELETLVLGGGIIAGELTFALSGKDLVITFLGAASDQVTVKNFIGRGALDRIVIGATTLTAAQMLEAATGATAGADNRGPTTIGADQAVVYGGRGADVLTGDLSADSFVFAKGDGQDTVRDWAGVLGLLASDDALLLVGGIRPGDLVLTRSGVDLVVTFATGTDSVTIVKQFDVDSTGGVESFRFEDGTVWSKADIRAATLAGLTTSNADTINGFDGADTLRGGLGADTMSGLAGDDRYLYAAGDGLDVITDTAGADRLEFAAGISSSGVTVTRSGADAVLTLSASDKVTLKDVFAPTPGGVEEVVFADGVIWTRADLASRVVGLTGSAGADTITGTPLGETLGGGAGADTLNGGDGGDIYLYARGDGADAIVDAGASGIDQLRLGAGVTAAGVSVRKGTDANDLVLDLGAGDTVTVRGYFAGQVVEQVVFADGMVWGARDIEQKILAASQTAGADTIQGTSAADRITGGLGADLIDGRGGADTYVFNRGDGQDVINDTGPEAGLDHLVLGASITAKDLDFVHGGPSGANDLVIKVRGTSDQLTLKNHFAPGGARIGDIRLGDGVLLKAADLIRLADNHAPTVATALVAKTVAQNAAFSYVLPTTAFADVDLDDGVLLTATLADGSALPSWLRFNGSTFTGTPGNADVGVRQVRVTAIDEAGDRIFQDFALTVTNVNDAPVATQILANRKATVGAAFSYQLPTGLFADPDTGVPGAPTQTVTLTAKLGSGANLPSWLTFNATTRTFSGTPNSSAQGALDIVITGSDGTASGTTRMGLYVGTTNAAPKVGTAMGTKTATEDAAFSFQIPTNAFTDTNTGDRMRYTATLSSGAALPAWLGLDTLTGLFTGTPENAAVGQSTIRVTATDIYGASISTTFILKVNQVNDAPTATADLQGFAIAEDAAFSYVIPADVFVDVDAGDALTLEAMRADGSALPDWLTFNAATRTFSGQPGESAVGIIDIVVRATDKAGAYVEKPLYLLIGGVNDAPVAAHPIPSQTLDRDAFFSFAVDPGAFRDVDSTGYSLSASLADGGNLPDWLQFDRQSWTFSGEPDYTAVGENEGLRSYRVKVVATDGQGAAGEQVFTIVVRGPNLGSYVQGTAGGETLTGTAGPDTLDGREGDDTLQGREGVDTYYFSEGWGHDTITDDYSTGSYTTRAQDDIIRFAAGVAPENLILSRVGPFGDAAIYYKDDDPTLISAYYNGTLVLTLASTGDSIVVESQMDSNGQPQNIAEIRFDNGAVWSAADITANFTTGTSGADFLAGDGMGNVISGGAGVDKLLGISGDDTLDGGAGNDDLYGGEGSDLYLFGRGSGQDRIADNLDYYVRGQDVDVLRFGAGITTSDLSFARDTRDPYPYSAPSLAGSLRISINGTDDSVLIYRQNYLDNGASGGIESFEFADGTVLTRQQMDVLISQNTELRGTDAAETLVGSSVGERILGLKGDDILRGLEGDDTYVWRLGDGNDTINESGVASFDKLEFGAGILASDITLSRELTSGATQLGLHVRQTGEQLSLQMEFYYTGMEATPVPTIDEIRFADGTVWDHDYLEAYFLQSTPGDDVITGFGRRPDRMDGGAGNDILNGLSHLDTYVFGRGYGVDRVIDRYDFVDPYPGDKIEFNATVASTDVTVDRQENFSQGFREVDVVFAINGTTDKLIVEHDAESISTISFGGDGSSWNMSGVNSRYVSGHSTAGGDVFVRLAETSISTLDGADVIVGQIGNTTLRGGAGNDTYLYREGGIGRDVIIESGLAGDIDKVEFGWNFAPAELEVLKAANGRDLILRHQSSSALIVLRDARVGAQASIDQVKFADGTIWSYATLLSRAVDIYAETHPITGTAAAETLTGTGKFDGLGGDDILQGQGDSDIYLYRAGSGNDRIVEGYGEGIDTVRLVALTAADVTLLKIGSDMGVKINATGETLTIEGQFGSSEYNGVEELVFSDGSVIDRSAFASLAAIGGTAGVDYLGGGSGDDIFLPGLGDDTVYSTTGSDTVIYASGDGSDFLDEESSSTTEIDTIRFTNLNPADVTFSHVGNDMMIKINATGHVIENDEFFWSTGSNYGFDRVVFANGTSWDRARLVSESWLQGSSGADTLSGAAFGDTLFGDAGADTLTGGGGADTFVFKPGGFGRDIITDFAPGTAGTDVARFMPGLFADFGAVQAAMSQVGANVVLTFDVQNSVTFNNTSLSAFTAGDFLFS